MSYNYSEFKKKKKDNFNPCIPPDDNPVPSGMIKDITRTAAEDFIHEYKNINGDIRKKSISLSMIIVPNTNEYFLNVNNFA